MSWSIGLVAAFILSSAGSGLALSIDHRAHLPDGGPGEGIAYAFLAWHKTGTELSLFLGHDFATVLGIPFRSGTDELEYNLPDQCYQGAVSVYSWGADETIRTCTDMRAVHEVRRPSAVLASFYVNTKHLDESTQPLDYGLLRDVKELYQRTPLSFGINHACTQTQYLSYSHQMESMTKTHRYLQHNPLERILEVSLEDFQNDYDHTTRSIFEHFLGKNDSRVDDLVEKAKRHDVARYPPEDALKFSDRNEETEAMTEMKRQFAAGNPCMQRVADFDVRMGYAFPF